MVINLVSDLEIEFQPLLAFSLEMLYTTCTYTLGDCLLLCEVSQKSI